MELKEKKVLVFGAGISGIGAAGLLLSAGADVVLYEGNAEKKEEDIKARELLQELKGKEDVTVDGKHIKLYANIGGVKDVTSVLANDAAGIGLFRSEFLYLEADNG